MINHKASITIKKHAAEVFKFVATDYFINHPKWDSRVVELQLASSGPMAIGTRGNETRKQGGRNVSYAFEVTDYQFNKLIAMKAKGGPAQFTATYAVARVAEGETRLDIEFNLSMGGLFRIMEPFMAGSFRKEVSGISSTIKQMLEA